VLRATATGYVTTQQNVTVVANQTVNVNLALSPVLNQGEIRIVLTWGALPTDLDSHLWLPWTHPYHIYFSNKGYCSSDPFACLDVDDTTSYGPETVTIKQRFSGNYTYAVYQWSSSGSLTTSGARVQVYSSTGLIRDYYVPTSGTGYWWAVFRMDGTTGVITDLNYITPTSPAPY
jgi:hypothetical protein